MTNHTPRISQSVSVDNTTYNTSQIFVYNFSLLFVYFIKYILFEV
jgi:hypothetical protein